ncbi:hypothetical protein TIFTF001_051654 [Ficus carica]|nr:hypothetical protein TIFTF001_051654 [Ficus carica]
MAARHVVLAERKLTTYVYAVGKRPTGNLLCKMGECGRANCEIWE